MLTLAYGCGLRARRGGAAASGRTSTASRRSSASCSRRDRKGPARDAASGGPEAVAAMVEGAADRRTTPASRQKQSWLFPGRSNHQPLTHASVQPAVQGSREKPRGCAKTLSSAFASSQLRDSSARAAARDIRVIQALLGHSKPETTGPLQSRGRIPSRSIRNRERLGPNHLVG